MIPIKNIFYMLAYAFRALDRKAYRSLESEDFPHAKDLLASILILGVEEQFKRGVSRAYIEKEAPLAAVRGRVLIEESIRTSRRNMHLVCARDEFSVNAYMNRILVTAMQSLVRSEEVASARRKALRTSLCMFKEVMPLDPRYILWNFRYDRNNQTYRLLMYVCRLVLEDRLPAQSDKKKPRRLLTTTRRFRGCTRSSSSATSPKRTRACTPVPGDWNGLWTTKDSACCPPCKPMSCLRMQPIEC